jgi:hypothetical protein
LAGPVQPLPPSRARVSPDLLASTRHAEHGGWPWQGPVRARVRARPAPGAVGHSLDAGVTYSVVVGQGGAGPCPLGVRRQERVGRLSGTSVLPPSQDKRTSPPIRVSICSPGGHVADQGSHGESWRSKPACGAVVGTRVAPLRRVERRATTRRKDTPELQRLLGRLASRRSEQLALPAGRGSPTPANARVAAVAAGHDPPAGNPGYQPPRILNRYPGCIPRAAQLQSRYVRSCAGPNEGA